MRETWYVLEDDTPGDPNDVAPNEKGALVHKSGKAVKLRDSGIPLTRGVDVDAIKAKEAAAKTTRELTAEKPAAGYKTRRG